MDDWPVVEEDAFKIGILGQQELESDAWMGSHIGNLSECILFCKKCFAPS
jgi:hypothetical protein